MSEIVFCVYKPKSGCKNKLLSCIKLNVPTLQKLGFATDRKPIICQSKEGQILEIFEWKSEASAKLAHSHPDVEAIWGKMEKYAEFSSLAKVLEADQPFVHLKAIDT